MKRAISIILCFLMISFIICGCSGNKNENQQSYLSEMSSEAAKGDSGSTGLEDTGKDTWKRPDQPVKVRYMLPDFGDPTYNLSSETKPLSIQRVEERVKELFNIEFEYEIGTGAEYDTLVSTRLAAGTDLPDIIYWQAPRTRLIELYDQGLILPLDELVKKYAPNLEKRYYQLSPEGIPENSNYDGKLLRIVEYSTNIQNLIQVLGIRYDWLGKLGMKAPETADEFYRTLKAFQEEDANGNGKKDEIMTSMGLWAMHRSLAHAFGVKNLAGAADSWYTDANGKVYNTILTSETKNYLMFLNKMINDGLLDKEISSQTWDQFVQKLTNDTISATAGSNWMAVFSQIMATKGMKSEYVQMKPLKKADGTSELYIWDYFGHKGHMITKDCKDPVTVIKMFDWCFSTEGSRLIYYGESDDNGEYWKKSDVPGVIDFTMTLTDKGKEASKEPDFMSRIGFNGLLPKQAMSSIPDIAVDLSGSFSNYGKGGDFNYIIEHLEACEKARIPSFKIFPANVEQQKLLDEKSDLFLYMDEMVEKFALGKESFDHWDQFIKKCNDLGLPAVLQQIQERHDRYETSIKEWIK